MPLFSEGLRVVRMEMRMLARKEFRVRRNWPAGSVELPILPSD
jgi:hypothetical protein